MKKLKIWYYKKMGNYYHEKWKLTVIEIGANEHNKNGYYHYLVEKDFIYFKNVLHYGFKEIETIRKGR